MKLDGQFARVPLWLALSGVSDRALKLFVIIAAQYSDFETGEAKAVPRKELADLMQKSIDTVDRAKAELVKVGALAIQKRFKNGARIADDLYLNYVDPSTEKDVDEGGRKFAATPPQICGEGGRTSAAALTDSFQKGSTDVDPCVDSRIPEVVDRLCTILAEALIADGEPRVTAEKKAGSKRWRDPLAEMLGAEDAPEPESVEAVLRWSQRDPVWRKKITTMAGFVALFGSVKRAAEADRRNPVRLDLPAAKPIAAVALASESDVAAFRETFAAEVSEDVYDIWLSQVWFGELERDGNRVLVMGASGRVRSWIELRYLRACKTVAASHGFVDVVMTGQNQPSLEVAHAA